LRGYDGTYHFLYAKKIKYIDVLLLGPADLAAADLLPI
jgi:hypothetical protein